MAPDREHHAPRARRIAIASGKGGVGKTWFAITLAHALSQLGRRVLLVDGDLGLANIDIQLGLTPPRDIGAVLAGRATLAQAVQFCPPIGASILAGQSGSGALAALPPDILGGLLSEIGALPFQEIVLDLGAGIDLTSRRLASWADLLLVLVTDEPTSLTDAYAVLKLLGQDRPGADARIVVNQAATAAAGARTNATLARACQHFLGVTPPLAGIIRHDTRVRDAIRRQAPLLTRHPASPASQDVTGIALGLT